MATQNWMRTYVMQAGLEGEMGLKIGNTDSAGQTALHIYFSIEKSDSETANTGKVQVWNLNGSNISLLEQESCKLILKAGYQNNNALVIQGTVSTVETEIDDADQMTEIEVIDGLIDTKDTAVSISLNETVSTEDLYSMAASEAGMSIVYGEGLEFPTIPNGFTFVGTVAELLSKVSDLCGHDYTIQNGVIQVTNPGEPVSTYGYLLSAETGLLSIPKRITISAEDDTEEDMTGYEVVYFLNASIGINDIVYIVSNKVSGYFRVHKLTIEGDNYEGDWICTAQVIQIADSSGATY